MRKIKILSTFAWSAFTLAMALVSAQAFSTPVSQSDSQATSESLFLAADESDGASLDDASGSAVQVPTSPPGNNEASVLGGENSQQGVTPDSGTNQDNNLASPPGAGQGNSEASES